MQLMIDTQKIFENVGEWKINSTKSEGGVAQKGISVILQLFNPTFYDG